MQKRKLGASGLEVSALSLGRRRPGVSASGYDRFESSSMLQNARGTIDQNHNDALAATSRVG
jgi:aryl-alcohol dehydrogenase-like predicted oxidoreductase